MKSILSYRTSTRGSLRLISNKQNSLETRIRVDRAQTLEMRSHKQIAIEQLIQQRRDRDLFPEIHAQRCYVSVEEGFKRRCSRTPMFLSQGRDHLSSPRSLTMDSSAWNRAYKLLVQLTIEIELSQARLAVQEPKAPRVTNLNPRARPKPSAQEMEKRLTSTNPSSCLLLTQIPQRNHSRMKRGE